MIKQLILVNYATIALIVCLLIFILTNNYFEKRVRTLFLIACMMLFGLAVADSVEFWTASFDHLSVLRIWMSAIGYSLRPTIIYVVIRLMMRQRARRRVWFAVPLFVNALLAFSALFTDVAYSYTADNQYVRGPLGYFAFVTSGFYLLMLLACTFKLYKSADISEAYISVAVVCMFGISTAMETVWKFEGVINVTGAVAMVFYYLYLNTQQFKRDPMTKALNRRCFYLDAEKNRLGLNAVISIDLNDLKHWNDGYGHAKGDDAICTVADCVQRVLPHGCHLYRTGGDEFAVLGFGKKEEEMKQVVREIRAEVEKTPYSCAVGMAYDDVQSDFQKLCSRADKEMYKNKMQMKSRV